MTIPGRTRPAGWVAVRPGAPGLAVMTVLAIYAWIVVAHVWQPSVNPPARQAYNLQADGFLAGQLNMLEPVPEGLAQLPDPYDPAANARYREPRPDGSRLHDVSYYRGKLYLYFGAAPALVLFGPWTWLTGGHFPQELAVLAFCSAGFLAGAWLYCRLAKTFFPEVSGGVVAAGLLAFGLAGGLPPLLLRPEIYEVAIACGHAFAMLALAATWRAVEQPRGRVGWSVVASLCYGLAIAARPSLLFGAVILLVPALAEWRERAATERKGRFPAVLAAAIGLVGLAGVGLLWFNAQRFGNPLEFGMKYQLAGVSQFSAPPLFNVRFIGHNLWIYFLEPVVWTSRSIFPIGAQMSSHPPGHLGIENPVGILTGAPCVCLAAALAFAGPAVAPERRWYFGAAIASIALVFVTGAGMISTFAGACLRYQAEFLPASMLLAGLGFLSLENRLAIYRRWRWVVRGVGGAALCYSLAAGLLIGASANSMYVTSRNRDMQALLERGRVAEPLAWFEAAARRYPGRVGVEWNLGTTYLGLGRLAEAVACFERAATADPLQDHVHNTLGLAFARQGRFEEARRCFARALQVNPRSAAAAANLATLDRGHSGAAASPE